MPKVVIETYSTFYDHATMTQFNPVLNRNTGCFVGVADADKKAAKEFEGRAAFLVLSDAEFTAYLSVPEAPETDEPASPSGDALTDQAGGQAPPEPPASGK